MIPFKCEQGCYSAGVAPAPITPSEYDELIQLIDKKQNKLAAGNGITIDENNIISSSYDDAEIKELIAANEKAIATLEESVNNKVDKVNGKGLSTNDYTTEEKNKLENIAENAQVNIIESVSVNGVALSVNNKSVNISVPTGALSSKDKVTEEDLTTDLATKINGKLDTSAVTGDLLTHNAAEFATADHNHDAVYSKLDHNHKIEGLEQADYIVFDCGTASSVI